MPAELEYWWSRGIMSFSIELIVLVNMNATDWYQEVKSWSDVLYCVLAGFHIGKSVFNFGPLLLLTDPVFFLLPQ